SLSGSAADNLPASRHRPGRNTDHRGTCRNIGDNKRIRPNRRIIADRDGSNNTRMATDPDMIPNDGSGRLGARPDSAYVVPGTIRSDFGSAVHANRTGMSDEETRPDAGTMVNTDVRYHCKQLLEDRQDYPCRGPSPSGSRTFSHLLESVER